MAANMAKSCSKQCIFMSAVHSFLYGSQIFIFIYMLELSMKICKLGLFAYSICLPGRDLKELTQLLISGISNEKTDLKIFKCTTEYIKNFGIFL